MAKAKEKVSKKMFPRTLYKRDEEGKLSFTNKKHRDVNYNSVVVENEEEKVAAVEMGYVDNFASILQEKSEEPVVGDEEF